MTETTLRQAIDGAQLIKFHGSRAMFVAWHGGTTFNVYTDMNGRVREIDVFSVCDDEGRPVGREAAEEHAEDWLSAERRA